jgi:hypothetical protein
LDRANAAVKAERLNHAREPLQRFDHLPDAVAQMVRDRWVSPRQAYRYLQQARRLKQPVPIGDTKVTFTVKLSQELVRRVRSFANITDLSLSEIDPCLTLTKGVLTGPGSSLQTCFTARLSTVVRPDPSP